MKAKSWLGWEHTTTWCASPASGEGTEDTLPSVVLARPVTGSAPLPIGCPPTHCCPPYWLLLWPSGTHTGHAPTPAVGGSTDVQLGQSPVASERDLRSPHPGSISGDTCGQLACRAGGKPGRGGAGRRAGGKPVVGCSVGPGGNGGPPPLLSSSPSSQSPGASGHPGHRAGGGSWVLFSSVRKDHVGDSFSPHTLPFCFWTARWMCFNRFQS